MTNFTQRYIKNRPNSERRKKRSVSSAEAWNTDLSIRDAVERTRTSTGVSPHGPEPCASANSATTAHSNAPVTAKS